MRLVAAMRTDVTLQAKNQLYAISVVVSVIVAGALAWLSPRDGLARTVPMGLLMFVGGSTLLYVVAMILLERADGTLDAICVSPLRSGEYLAAKVITLTLLATLEGTLITAGTLALLARQGPVPLPNAWLVVGLLALGAMHVLVGVVLVVRYRRLSEALMPMSALALLFQLPAFHFVGAFDHPALLAIPSAPPTLLVKAAFVPLEPWELAYGLVATTIIVGALSAWALRAFEAHVVRQAG